MLGCSSIVFATDESPLGLVQKPTTSPTGIQRQSRADPHGGTSNGEQRPEHTTASVFFIGNITKNHILKLEQMNTSAYIIIFCNSEIYKHERLKEYEEEWNGTYWKWQARREPKEQP